ncbi:hypothetical protein L195_g045848, partial [Trifolium pratense]
MNGGATDERKRYDGGGKKSKRS